VRVELFGLNLQVFQNATAEDRFVNDPWHVRHSDSAVPHVLWVDHDGRTQFALIETSGMVCSHKRVQIAFGELDLEGVPQGLPAIWIAAASAVARLTPIAANKNMVRESRHESSALKSVQIFDQSGKWSRV
jgi:hypothetical protein